MLPSITPSTLTKKTGGVSMPKRRFSYSAMEYAIGEYITGQNAERNRDILKLYFLNGYSQEQIAEIHGMSTV